MKTLEFLSTYINVWNTSLYQQTIGIPMGTNCTFVEFLEIREIKETNGRSPLVYVLPLNLIKLNSKFVYPGDRIYPFEFEIRDITDSHTVTSQLYSDFTIII